MEAAAAYKDMELINQKFFKNSHHWTFELKRLTLYTQDLIVLSVNVNIQKINLEENPYTWD